MVYLLLVVRPASALFNRPERDGLLDVGRSASLRLIQQARARWFTCCWSFGQPPPYSTGPSEMVYLLLVVRPASALFNRPERDGLLVVGRSASLRLIQQARARWFTCCWSFGQPPPYSTGPSEMVYLMLVVRLSYLSSNRFDHISRMTTVVKHPS